MERAKGKIDYWYLIVAFLLIYLGSNTLYTQILFSTQNSAYFVFFLSVAIFFVNFKDRISFDSHTLLTIIAFFALIVITMLVNIDVNNTNGYVIIMMKIVGAALCLKCLDLKRFIKAYSDVMVILAMASLIVTYLFPVFSLEKMLPLVSNRMGIQFYNGFLAFKINSYGTFGIRNYGIFSEPAVYSYYLFLGALFSYKYCEKTVTNCLRMCVLILAMITTFSPIGLATATIMYILLVVKVIKESSDSQIKWIPFICLFVAIIYFVFSPDMIAGWNFLISKANVSSTAGAGRITCIYFNIVKWLEKPLFGGGLEAITGIASELGFNTSTTGVMLSGFGTLFAAIVTIIQFRTISLVLTRRNMFLTMIFFVLFMLQINNHSLIQADWFWMFTMIGVVYGKDETFNHDLQLGEYV